MTVHPQRLALAQPPAPDRACAPRGGRRGPASRLLLAWCRAGGGEPGPGALGSPFPPLRAQGVSTGCRPLPSGRAVPHTRVPCGPRRKVGTCPRMPRTPSLGARPQRTGRLPQPGSREPPAVSFPGLGGADGGRCGARLGLRGGPPAALLPTPRPPPSAPRPEPRGTLCSLHRRKTEAVSRQSHAGGADCRVPARLLLARGSSLLDEHENPGDSC